MVLNEKTTILSGSLEEGEFEFESRNWRSRLQPRRYMSDTRHNLYHESTDPYPILLTVYSCCGLWSLLLTESPSVSCGKAEQVEVDRGSPVFRECKFGISWCSWVFVLRRGLRLKQTVGVRN